MNWSFACTYIGGEVEELDRTAAVELPARIDAFIAREETHFQTQALVEVLWNAYSKEPYFFPAKRTVFEALDAQPVL